MTPLVYLIWAFLIVALVGTGPDLIPMRLFKDPIIAYLAHTPDDTPI